MWVEGGVQGESMEPQRKIRDRRRSARVKTNRPSSHRRIDEKGRVLEPRPSRSINVSSDGAKLRSDWPVDSGETLKVNIDLGESTVAFIGTVVYVIPSPTQGFKLGIAVKIIGAEDRIALSRFIIQKWQEEGDQTHFEQLSKNSSSI
jgi:hypothetical protein